MKLQPVDALVLSRAVDNSPAYILMRRAPFIAVQIAAMTRNGSTLRVFWFITEWSAILCVARKICDLINRMFLLVSTAPSSYHCGYNWLQSPERCVEVLIIKSCQRVYIAR